MSHHNPFNPAAGFVGSAAPGGFYAADPAAAAQQQAAAGEESRAEQNRGRTLSILTFVGRPSLPNLCL